VCPKSCPTCYELLAAATATATTTTIFETITIISMGNQKYIFVKDRGLNTHSLSVFHSFRKSFVCLCLRFVVISLESIYLESVCVWEAR